MINTTARFTCRWGHAHRPGPCSLFLRSLLSGLGRAAFRSRCPVPARRMLPHPRSAPALGCTSWGATASAAPAVGLCQTVRGFPGLYGKRLIRKLPRAFTYCQKYELPYPLSQAASKGFRKACCLLLLVEGVRCQADAGCVRPTRPSQPAAPGAGPAAVFWCLQANTSWGICPASHAQDAHPQFHL